MSEKRHVPPCPRAVYPRKGDKCSCGFDERSAREANERRKPVPTIDLMHALKASLDQKGAPPK